MRTALYVMEMESSSLSATPFAPVNAIAVQNAEKVLEVKQTIFFTLELVKIV